MTSQSQYVMSEISSLEAPQRHTYFQADSEGRGPGFGEKCGASAVAATQRLGAFVEDYLAT